MLNLGHPLLEYETEKWNQGYRCVAGVDEAGRGPLAGPVVACSFVILSLDVDLDGVNDSKKLTPRKRKDLFQRLKEMNNVLYALGVVSSEVIDSINILEATKLAMQQSIEALSERPNYLLVDGMPLPKQPIPSDGLIKGDSKSFSIAAASIIAKETRDQLMLEYHEKWPQYGFDKHKGYGTKLHMEALKKYGPCPIHRESFAPVRQAMTISG